MVESLKNIQNLPFFELRKKFFYTSEIGYSFDLVHQLIHVVYKFIKL